FISGPKSNNPQLTFSVSDGALKSNIESGRVTTEETLKAWALLNNQIPGASDPSAFLIPINQNLLKIKGFLDLVALAVNSLTPSYTLSTATIDAYRTDVSTARANVNTALSNMSAAVEKLQSAKSSLELAKQELILKKAGPTPEMLATEQAKVKQAQAKVQNIRAQIAKTLLRAPIAGVVTKQESKVGEIASIGVNMVSVMSDSKYEIEANIPEADISKIKVGNEAKVTLDAYGNDIVFGTIVSSIDPAETVIDGISTYKTTLQFKIPDARIRSGMTANTDIEGERRSNVLFLPGRVIATKEGVKTVSVIAGKDTYEITITTGLRGSNGDVEILSGLSEGEIVKMR
ncbi:MAG: efflux RND transporter periplasmic adaptor subunit, partial [Patescibacteria group bacterium]